MARENINLILQQKPTMALLTIAREKKTYASLISREIESTFAHTANILAKLEGQGLVRFECKGDDNRVKEVELTPKGRNAAVLIEDLAAVLEGKKNATTKKKNITIHRKKSTNEKKTVDLADKLQMIKTQITLISKQELGEKKSIVQEDFVRIGQRLGPYRRELRRIIELGKKEDVKKAKKADEMIDDIFEVRGKLRERE